MAKGKRARSGRGSKNGQSPRQANRKSASYRSSRAYSQTSDFDHVTFTLHDAVRRTGKKSNHTPASAVSLRHRSMNFVRGNEELEQDSDYENSMNSLQRETEASELNLETSATNDLRVSGLEHLKDIQDVIPEERRPDKDTFSPNTSSPQGYTRHPRSLSTSSDEVVFVGRKNMERTLTKEVSFEGVQTHAVEALDILATPAQLRRTSSQPEADSFATRLKLSLPSGEGYASSNAEAAVKVLPPSVSARVELSRASSSESSDSTRGFDDYVTNIRENDKFNIGSESLTAGFIEPKATSRDATPEAKQCPKMHRNYQKSDDDADSIDSSWSSNIRSENIACPEDFDEEQNFIERDITRMTDEHIARLFQKQEYLGWNADELQIFDGYDDFEISDDFLQGRPPNSQSKRRKRRVRAQPPSIIDELSDNLLEGEDYGDFDVMDYERPSISKNKTFQNNPFLLDLSDSELAQGLRDAWASDRKKKRQKKVEREELRAQGMLGKDRNDTPDLKAKYNSGMNLSQVEGELRGFLFNGQRDTLSLPPMAKQERKILHDIANSFGLKSKSQGSNQKRFTILYKTSKTVEFDEVIFERLRAQLNRRFLPRMDRKGRKVSKAPIRGAPAHKGYRDGEIVGGAAPELGAENRGRAMLEKMGWSSGTALGATNNQGILKPIEHIVKNSKAGLG